MNAAALARHISDDLECSPRLAPKWVSMLLRPDSYGHAETVAHLRATYGEEMASSIESRVRQEADR